MLELYFLNDGKYVGMKSAVFYFFKVLCKQFVDLVKCGMLIFFNFFFWVKLLYRN